ncbi:undecaprenyl-diphosphatase [Brevibacillus daliensis]|uniref:undecaprenyl-diphosphatase n=1 Tax=Brevibacillus daliensis TaxID=2892995 RepID=UPI00210465E4|nr:undecaprenyl-diphosphatase [Brevibacillus daliensis]
MIVHAAHYMANSFAPLGWIMIFFASYAEFLFYLSIPLYWFIGNRKNKRMIIQTTIVVTIAMLISWICGQFFYRDRPFVGGSFVPLVEHDADASFPSDHATAALAIATTYWFCLKAQAKKFWIALAIAVAISRVFVGVHYLTDVIVGMLLGAGVAWLVNRFLPSWKQGNYLIDEGITLYETMASNLLKKQPPRSGRKRKV